MKNYHFRFLFILTLIFNSCIKDELNINEQEEIYNPFEDKLEPFDKFIGNYKVYDTIFNYLHDMSISHFSGINQYGVEVDSLRIINFADSFNFVIPFQNSQNKNYLDLFYVDTLYSYSGKRFFFWGNSDDLSTPNIIENELVNDTVLLYYSLDNIKYYLYENVPYYQCDCKQFAVKQ